jgi:hypothetical protein
MLDYMVQAFLPGSRKLPDYECLITYALFIGLLGDFTFLDRQCSGIFCF